MILLILAVSASADQQLPKGVDAGAARPVPANINKVVMIVIDTLRADHLPFYGYARNTAPFLTRLAEKSVLFERTFSASSTTAPSMASIFTSLYPSEHGIITGFVATKHLTKKDQSISLNRLPDTLTLLGEVMSQAGFRTFGVADNINIGPDMGFTQGFDAFETFRYLGAENLNQVVRKWGPEIEKSKRWFLYLHYMDPHKPYHEREPWFDPATKGTQRLISAYDSEISYTDSKLKELFEEFGWEKDCLVVMVADHGEEFGDHGNHGHGKSLYREVIHVPFFVYHPGLRAQRVSDGVHSMDILPTLAGLLGITPNPVWRGRDLLSGNMSESDKRSASEKNRELFSELLRRPDHVKESRQSMLIQRNRLYRSPNRSFFQPG